MKIVWLVNIVMPELAEELGLWKTSLGGWLVGQLEGLKNTGNDITIITVPADVNEIVYRKINNINYYLVPKGDDSKLSSDFKELLRELNPDVFHIFGTETHEAEIAFNIADPGKTVISIQGLVSVYAAHIASGISNTDGLICFGALFTISKNYL